MITFQKDPVVTGISDQMTLGGWTFDAQLAVSRRNGNAAAIHCGRILFLQITCEEEVIVYFDNGIWYQLPDKDFGEGWLAKELFIQKWSRADALNEGDI